MQLRNLSFYLFKWTNSGPTVHDSWPSHNFPTLFALCYKRRVHLRHNYVALFQCCKCSRGINFEKVAGKFIKYFSTITVLVIKISTASFFYSLQAFLWCYTTSLIGCSSFLVLSLGWECLWAAPISYLSHKLSLWCGNVCYGLWVCLQNYKQVHCAWFVLRWKVK